MASPGDCPFFRCLRGCAASSGRAEIPQKDEKWKNSVFIVGSTVVPSTGMLTAKAFSLRQTRHQGVWDALQMLHQSPKIYSPP